MTHTPFSSGTPPQRELSLAQPKASGINRQAVVARHAVRITAPNPEHVLTVGNGDFAFSADITGMQTFTDYHDARAAMAGGGVAVNTATMSSWGWHEMPNPGDYTLEDAMSHYETSRGPVSYPDKYDMQQAMRGELSDENKPGAWLHANPQRIDLGRLGLELRQTPGGAIENNPHALTAVHQELNLWTGLIESTFRYAGELVRVQTVTAPHSAAVGFRVRSSLLSDGRLTVSIRFPYASDGFFQTSDWDAPDRHTSVLTPQQAGRASILRQLDATSYRVDVDTNNARISQTDHPHYFRVESAKESLDIVAAFASDPTVPREWPTDYVGFEPLRQAAAQSWKRFWSSGAAIDAQGNADPRAQELERRAVLSQYLTAVNCAGVAPPQETGLITNSWQGKFHLEMHLLHAAHFATWGRPELLARSMPWYLSILGQARKTAARQGYPGARWPKHVGPNGRESPDPIGSLLIWQQPHPLYLLELLWNASCPQEREALAHAYAELVEDTATFMAAFTEERDGAYHLPAPIMPAQEFYDAATTENPTFELAYWWFGLEIAQRWRERTGQERIDTWTAIQDNLAQPHQQADRYAAVATEPYLRCDDHPSFLAAYGLVPPTPLIDPGRMEKSLRYVLNSWEWPSAWGWDFPVMAMTAARLGNPELAMDCLLRDEARNRHTAVGHNPQLGGILPLYLPGNGAFLAAVSLLAAENESGNGFPEDWNVKAEGFVPWPKAVEPRI
ncbi:hypothetical protein PUN71_015735 [Arthrobacter sp. NQ7]|uniref:hypothetical protein n=1 Tax=Arthrobacter sp. NQ7 TaxID=3032303 RepID=UPI00240EA40A|nr:hypothetical protein [Arthrobacter sp. NQ7]MDJ0458654.1 hypothetical protein [Arthrobacter sp. NQ7]